VIRVQAIVAAISETGETNPQVAKLTIRFDDGAGYERAMGVWSRLAGDVFLDWLAPPLGLRWIDIGCGNGAFTELLVQRCAPEEVHAIDPSECQLAFARKRPAMRPAAFHQGDAMALPYPADRFDAAVMALVIVFLSDPAKAIDEMVRVVRPGGRVATYVWDMLDGGFPLDPILNEIRTTGFVLPSPPRTSASRMDVLRDLWIRAGLEDVVTREVTVERTFADFDDFWMTNLTGPTVGSAIAGMASGEAEELKRRVRVRLSGFAGRPITCRARANAIRGCVPVS
jgi:ubiquinone/menaquinone biosynthesis C-methylase UbiE